MANSSIAVRAQFDELRSLAAASVATTYTAIGTAFAFPPRLVIIQNLTDVTLLFSNDDNPVVASKKNKLRLPAGTQVVLDVTTNHAMGKSFVFPVGTIIYAKQDGSAATTGTVDVSMIYGDL